MSSSIVTATGVALSWSSADGANYRVLYSETLPGEWTPIATIPSGGASTTYTDTDGTRRARATGFYQIAVEP